MRWGLSLIGLIGGLASPQAQACEFHNAAAVANLFNEVVSGGAPRPDRCPPPTAFAGVRAGASGAVGFPEGSFCVDPMTAICGVSDDGERAAFRERLRAREVRYDRDVAEGLQAAARKAIELGLWSGTPSNFSVYDYVAAIGAAGPVRAMQLVRAMNMHAERYDALAERAVAATKTRLIAAIQGELEQSNIRNSMVETIRDATYASPHNASRVIGDDPEMLKEFEKEYLKFCTPTGKKDNAALITMRVHNVTRSFMVICPYFYLGAAATTRAGEDEEISDILMGVMGHELAHGIDPNATDGYYAPAYGALAACMRMIPPYSEEAEGRFGEIVPDHWSIRAAVRRLRSMNGGRGATPEQALPILRRYHATDCRDAKPGRKHPSSSFRLDTHLRNDPDISAIMGCGPVNLAQPRNTCGFNGRALLQ
jgi:hypothetical protein